MSDDKKRYHVSERRLRLSVELLAATSVSEIAKELWPVEGDEAGGKR